jgi:tetratricopeptide (TPR) repeat protein
MEAKLRSFADKPGPRQESAVMDLISFLSRKDVNKIDEALAAASQHKSLFQGEKRAKFLNMFAPLLVKGLRYDNAITHYEQLLQLRPTRVALVYNQIAFCHLKQERFVKALANAQQAEALSRDPIDHTPAIRSQVLAHVGLRNWDEARAALDRGRWLADSVRGVLQEVIDSAERGEDASSSLSASLSQEFELGAYDRDAIAFMVQRSPYLSSLLDANQYEGVNIRLQRDDGSFYVATDHRKLVIGGLQEDIRKARKFGKEAYFRIQERCLSLACLFRDRAYDTEDLDEAEGSREGFIQYAALALIYKAMVYERHTALPDYLAMLYTESLTLLARREGESEGSADEYRTCLNGLIIACVAGVRGTEDVSERNRSFIGSQSSNALHDDYVAETFKIAFTLAPDALLTGLILSVANSGEAANSLSSKLLGLLRGLRLEEEAKSRLQTLFNLARSGWTLERYLNECVSQTRATGELVKTHLDALVFQLTTGTESELIQELLGQLSTAADSPSVCYSDAERLRIIISVGQHALSMMSAKDFSVAKESYDKAVATINGARQAIEVNPTKASFELIGPMLPTLAPALDGLLNNRYLGALPRLTLTDDASADGYAPLNNRINVQLRLHNGGRTVASAIRLAFTEDAESRRLYSVQSGDTTDLSIGAGRSECVPITLFLTEAGSAPDTLMDLKISASYKTIRDEEQTTEFATLSIGIQSDGAWTDDIPNPYNSGTELEPRSTGVLYGREGDILSITQQMSNRASGGDAVLIYGQYRCGKSSLKNYVVDGLMKKDNNLVVASLSAKAEWTHRDFSFNVLNEIRKSFREHDPAISLPGLEVYAESVQAALNSAPGEYLQDQLEEIGRLLNDRDMRLLLVIDEFGRIFESPALATSFMQYWKGLMALRVFKTIAIAHDVITEQIRRNENEFAVFQARQLNYISQRATTALVQEPMHDTARDRDRILPDAVEYIWWLTAGQVWYIQMLCHQVVIDMNLYKYQSVNRTRAQEAVRAWAGTMASHDLEGKFHPMFRSGEGGDSVVGDDDAKSVLRAIAEAAAATGGVRARRVDVHQKLQEMYLGPLDADTILASLTARWVVDHDEATDSFEIRVKLYHEYLLGRL